MIDKIENIKVRADMARDLLAQAKQRMGLFQHPNTANVERLLNDVDDLIAEVERLRAKTDEQFDTIRHLEFEKVVQNG